MTNSITKVRYFDADPDYCNPLRGWDYEMKVIRFNRKCHTQFLAEYPDGSWEVLDLNDKGVEILD